MLLLLMMIYMLMCAVPFARLDVQPMLPPVLSVEDAAALLGRCSAVKAAAGSGKSAVRVLAATCAFSGEFLKARKLRPCTPCICAPTAYVEKAIQ